jgi:hypothetical protein
VHCDPQCIATPGCIASCVALRPAVRCDLRCIAVVGASRSGLRCDLRCIAVVGASRSGLRCDNEKATGRACACDASRELVAL